MPYIKKVHIEGFKRFENFTIELNPDITILAGDNESGKTTILEAIDLALNGGAKSFDLSMLQILMNVKSIDRFKNNPSVNSLPEIKIQIFFSGMERIPEYSCFYGPYYSTNTGDLNEYGIEFLAKFDNSMLSMLNEQILSGNIPFEFYQISTNTFANQTYRPKLSDVSFCLINASLGGPNFSSYSKMMFNALFDNKEQMTLKNKFSVEMNRAISDTMQIIPNADSKFNYDIQKASLENIVTLYENGLPLSSIGQGKEAIIKTKMLLKSHQKASIIGLEEPENHLSHSTMESMLSTIAKNKTGKQIIISSHSNRIASGLGLNKIVGLSKDSEEVMSLSGLPKETCDYFLAIPSDNMLHFLLSKKAILVEGPAEYIYMDLFCKKVLNKSLSEANLTCISMNGLSFKHYVNIGSLMKKKICIITDNDGNIERSKNFESTLSDIYEEKKLFGFFSDSDPERRTFEVCLYNDNQTIIDETLNIKEGADYNHDYSKGNKRLGKMLNDKTGTALELSSNAKFIEGFKVPEYIKNALEFISNE